MNNNTRILLQKKRDILDKQKKVRKNVHTQNTYILSLLSIFIKMSCHKLIFILRFNCKTSTKLQLMSYKRYLKNMNFDSIVFFKLSSYICYHHSVKMFNNSNLKRVFKLFFFGENIQVLLSEHISIIQTVLFFFTLPLKKPKIRNRIRTMLVLSLIVVMLPSSHLEERVLSTGAKGHKYHNGTILFLPQISV